MRKSRHWLGCAAVMCLTVAQLSGCSSKPLVSGFRVPGLKSRDSLAEKSSKKASPEAAGDLLAQAREYEKLGDFPNAARMYREYLNNGGEPLRPDSPALAKADQANAAKQSALKTPSPEALARNSQKRESVPTRTASRPTSPPPSRNATQADEKRPERAVAKKPAPASQEDPWADKEESARDELAQKKPVIRPGKSTETAKPAPSSATPRSAVAQAENDAGIPDWAKGEAVAKKSPPKVSQEEIDDLLDLDEGEIDWGDESEAGSEIEERPVVQSQKKTADPKGTDDEDAMEPPQFEEEEGSDEVVSDDSAEAEDEDAWGAHQDLDPDAMKQSEDVESEVASSEELSEPVLDQEAPEETQPSIALLCKDCEPWVYAQAVNLESPDPEIRKESLTKLADMGSQARQAGLAVRTLMDDSDPLVQAHAAWALWEIENEPVECVTTLSDLLDHPNSEVIQLACYMLGDIGPQAETARHSLELLRDHAEGSTRIHAAEALVRISGVDQSSISVLVEAAKSKDPEERWIAAVALGRCRGDDSQQAVKALLSALKDIDPEVRSAAALSLGGLGTDAASAKAELEKVAQNDDPQVRDAALAALACLNK